MAELGKPAIIGSDAETEALVMNDFENAVTSIRAGARFYLVVINAKVGEEITGTTTVESIGRLSTNLDYEVVHRAIHSSFDEVSVPADDAEDGPGDYSGLTISDM